MGKHAYLVMVHNDVDLFIKLISLLDYKDNDIYVHIDKKAIGFEQAYIKSFVKESKILFVNRHNVQWGGYSQIECEMTLLEAAINGKYDYYHLISGADLPLKSQRYIHDYFNSNLGLEYIGFDNKANVTRNFEYRIKYYHLLQNIIGRQRNVIYLPLISLSKSLLFVQRLIGINRIKNSEYVFSKGSNWFSITHELASHILSQNKCIKKHFSYTFCADEIFIHTIVENSRFKEKLANDSLRLTDWNRGKPYVYTKEDFDFLVKSDKLWARKFSTLKDVEIIDAIIKVIETK